MRRVRPGLALAVLATFVGAAVLVQSLDFPTTALSFEWEDDIEPVVNVNYAATALELSPDETYAIIVGTVTGRAKDGIKEPLLQDDQIASQIDRNTRDDIVVHKRMLDGTATEWSFRTGSVIDDVANAVLFVNNKIYIAGGMGSAGGKTSAGNKDAFLMRVSLDGEREEMWYWGGRGDDAVVDMVADGGFIYMVGYSRAGLTANDPVFGGSDGFVIKFNVATGSSQFVQSGFEPSDEFKSVAFKDGKLYIGAEYDKPLSDLTSGTAQIIEIGQIGVAVYNADTLALESSKLEDGYSQEFLVGLGVDPSGRNGVYTCGTTIIKAVYTKEDFSVRRYADSTLAETMERKIIDSRVDSGTLNGGRDVVTHCMMTSSGNLVVLGVSDGVLVDGVPGQRYADGSVVVMVFNPSGEQVFVSQTLVDTSAGEQPDIDSAPTMAKLTRNGNLVIAGSTKNNLRRSTMVLGGLQLSQAALAQYPAPVGPEPIVSPPVETEAPAQSQAPAPAPVPSDQVIDGASGQDETTVDGQSGADSPSGSSPDQAAAPSGGTSMVLIIAAAVGGLVALVGVIAVFIVVRRRAAAAHVDPTMPSDGLVRRRTTGKMETIDLERGRNSAMPM
ncbi:hypothetical protein FVE85_0961 [Porphyridium purpureum]|uniref:Uncharacterized protein n=1 Tax=Porphyridium purpureum TaxID=35688 RepID=A0A5J4Z260_PORPP|nr:hypothetical protein FVE85_0961 [Porphyridium purpureum]|eukprot:POR1895..scf208_2